MRCWLLVFFWLSSVLSSSVTAQQARYQLGKQVIGFETAFQQSLAEIQARKAVLPSLERAVQAFFSMSFTGAEKSIDEAWLQLLPENQQALLSSLIPLRLSLAKHWYDTAEEELLLELALAYESKTPLQLPVTMQIEFVDAQGKRTQVEAKTLTKLPFKETVSIKELEEGDWEILVTIQSSDVQWLLPKQMVSRTKDLGSRFSEVKEQVDQAKAKASDTQQRSTQLMLNILRDLRNGRKLETDFPAHQILRTLQEWNASRWSEQNQNAVNHNAVKQEAEPQSLEQDALPTLGGSYLPGQYWLELAGKKSSSVVRISVPPQSSGKLPVLFAFHGAGGSENMFFDAYGAGEIVSLSRKAGYVLVCPRQPLLGGLLSMEEMLEQLALLAPIDMERVAVLGHSMGAAQAIAQVERGKPGMVRGAVILGGGRGVSKPEIWRSIPVFAGAGDRDFGKRGVQQFAASCRKEGGVVREETYEAIEHLGIVQVALPDVFQWLEPHLKK